MTADLVQQYAPLAQEALHSFLSTLLDDEASLELGAPSEAESGGLKDELDAGLVVGAEGVFFVSLDRSWVKLVSESMLGRQIEIDDEGVDDLFREIASQGYGTLRNQLSARDLKLPDLSIEPYLPDTAVPQLSATGWRVPFQLTYDGTSYDGYALLLGDEASDAPAAESDTPTAEDLAAEIAQDDASELGDEDMPDPTPAGQGGVSVASANFSELGEEKIHGPRADTKNFELLSEVELEVSVELGRRRLPLSDVLQLTSGSVIELEKLVGEPLSLYANGRFVAEGEAVVIDEKFGIRITSLAPKNKQSEALM